MPLQEGSSKKAFSQNVDELVSSWKKTKKIGTSNPQGVNKARKQALAIAFDKKRGN
jgi:hypothetical protein